MAEDTQVQLTLWRYPDSLRTAKMSITVPESDQQMKIKISIQAEGSNMPVDTRTYTLEPEDSHLIEETFEIPDNRNYTYTVYNGESQLEQKALDAD